MQQENTPTENTPGTASTISTPSTTGMMSGKLLQVDAGAVKLPGILHMPENAHGLVLLTYGIQGVPGSTHKIALTLAQAFYRDGLASLLVDLFTPEEQLLDQGTDYFRLNTNIMEQRIMGIAEWLLDEGNVETRNLSIGYFGAGATGAAVLIAAAERPDVVEAVVSAGGMLDRAQDYIRRIMAPTLLIAAQQDDKAVPLSQQTHENLLVEKQLEFVEDPPPLFSTLDSIQRVGQLATQWFTKHLVRIV